ncbi:protein-disulfide reductase DsbD family protein [Arenimonas caeni]|uniref:Cytochrome C biogenesis protein n=1 Tax=Arenimonas caeni TaxID=2058085 RepID=A0A2P6M6C4_9GAMM|nr:protein-disulfide reductase DsbD [Arenimonas caeni]PRH81475.1 cytochrome C biogenesis protein [Arenimonas caeni]
MTRWLTALLALLLIAPAAKAVDEADLLPIDEAFALTARAPERGRIELNWRIAEGYYLYRHRMGVEVLSMGFKSDPLGLPDGIAYTDEFFGDVETYRDDVTAVLTGAAADGVPSIELKVKYQGCADIGICYPPHTRTLRVALPADAGVAPAALPGAGGIDLLGGTNPAIAAGGLPLPENQAFRFEAIVDTADRLALRFTPAPGYYLYRERNSVELQAEGVHAGEIQWPPSQPYFDEHFGNVEVYFDPVDAPLPLQREHTRAVPAVLRVTFQGCQDEGICYPPMTREVALHLPAGGTVAQSPAGAPSGANPFSAEGKGESFAPEGAPANAPTLWFAMLLALGGGVILNLMPCVLPVLSLKALSLAQGGGNHRKARSQALWYTAGVLVSFAAVGAAALALRQAGLALGWGFQLQQPGVIAALALVMVAIGLSLSGVVSLGASLAGAGQSLTEKTGPAGDFFTGVLAVVVASPCTAPFMGTALAFAFAASPAVAIGVFLALGLGLALPFLLIGFVPALAARLPRPGAWMETFKHLLAFPMYLTAVWLLWVLAKQRGADAIGLALVGAVGLGLGLWLWEKARFKGALAKSLAVLVVLAALWPVVVVQRMPAPAKSEAVKEGVVAYSAERLAQLRRDGRVVFVNMTADWCVSCKANERTVLGRDGFRDALERAGAVYMVGDWTDVDPEITAFLESHQAVGVPLYVVYPKAGEPKVLPTLLTQAIVDEALAEAGR